VKIFGFLLIILLLTGALFYDKNFNYTQNSKDEIFTIPANSTAAATTRMLKRRGVIRSSSVFLFQVRLLNAEKRIKAGKYKACAHRPIFSFIEKLYSGITVPPPVYSITIPEGFNMYQVVQRLNQDTDIVRPSVFLSLCKNKAFIKSLGIDAPTLEGFLFPDTYKISLDMSETDVIKLLVENFKQKTEPYFSGLPWSKKYEYLKMASIVEKETQVDTERALVASVYYNRLRIRMHLDADPTIRYALDKDTLALRYKDLKVKSPYNTYRRYGLPPTPITNPGSKAIAAAVFPAESSYLYFVSNANGGHVFSKTLREQINAKRKFKRLRRLKKLKERRANAKN